MNAETNESIARKCAEEIRPDHIDKRDWHDHSQPFILAAISEATEQLQRENEHLRKVYDACYEITGHPTVSSEPVTSAVLRLKSERDQLQREMDELENERYKLQVNNKCLEDELVSLRVFKSPAQLEMEQERDSLKREVEKLKREQEYFMGVTQVESKAMREDNERLREALKQFSECNLNESNCASLELASKRIRNVANAALNPPVEGGEK